MFASGKAVYEEIQKRKGQKAETPDDFADTNLDGRHWYRVFNRQGKDTHNVTEGEEQDAVVENNENHEELGSYADDDIEESLGGLQLEEIEAEKHQPEPTEQPQVDPFANSQGTNPFWIWKMGRTESARGSDRPQREIDALKRAVHNQKPGEDYRVQRWGNCKAPKAREAQQQHPDKHIKHCQAVIYFLKLRVSNIDRDNYLFSDA